MENSGWRNSCMLWYRLLHSYSIIQSRKSQAMATPPPKTHANLRVLKKNDYNYDSGVMVNHLADIDLDISLFWHVCSMLLYLIYFWCVWADLLYFLVWLLILVHLPIPQTVLSSFAVWFLSTWLNILVNFKLWPHLSSPLKFDSITNGIKLA